MKTIKKYIALVIVFAFIGAGFILLSIDYETMKTATEGIVASLCCFCMAVLVLFFANVKNLIEQ